MLPFVDKQIQCTNDHDAVLCEFPIIIRTHDAAYYDLCPHHATYFYLGYQESECLVTARCSNHQLGLYGAELTESQYLIYCVIHS